MSEKEVPISQPTAQRARPQTVIGQVTMLVVGFVGGDRHRAKAVAGDMRKGGITSGTILEQQRAKGGILHPDDIARMKQRKVKVTPRQVSYFDRMIEDWRDAPPYARVVLCVVWASILIVVGLIALWCYGR